MNEKVKRLKGEKVKGLKADAKPKMTAEQKALLAACKSLDADVERAKEINELSLCVHREMCNTCKNEQCHECGPNPKCMLASIASVAVGMILEAKGGAK